MRNITIIDYGLGNIRSMLNALKRVGANVVVSNNPDEIVSADGVVLPGVGAFSHGMDYFLANNLEKPLRQVVHTGKPLLGVCLGMQMFFDSSTEFGFTKGLGLIPGVVGSLELGEDSPYKLPHVGWAGLQAVRTKYTYNLLESVTKMDDVYFVHGYAAQPENSENIMSSTSYAGNDFCSTVAVNRVFGCQFHPEKSGEVGLKILNNFMNIVKVNSNE